MQNQTVEQVVKTLKDANNVLVTVRNSPSVDELTAAIGLTLILNKLDKHAITVFSGRIPSTIEFLKPESAIHTNTDSLRDFIISLDKAKADKLRYKVEDNVVRIFITPYRSAIGEHDLEFSQGEFNVDVVVALGVVEKDDFDQAVTMHGRILHDATVLTMTRKDVVSQLGSINWHEQDASSLSEMIAGVTDQLGEGVLDGQIATALMTGIIAETDRFRNEHTTPQVLTLSAKLMSAGANQMLIAEKLEEPDMSTVAAPLSEEEHGEGEESKANDDGSLEIDHEDEKKIHIDDSGNLMPHHEAPEAEQPSEQVPLKEPISEEEVKEQGAEVPVDQLAEHREYVEDTQMKPAMFGQDDGGDDSAQPLFDEPVSGAATALHEIVDTPEPDSFVAPEQPKESKRKIIQPLSVSESQAIPEPATIESMAAAAQHIPPVNYEETPVAAPPIIEPTKTEAPAPPETSATESANLDAFFGTTREQVVVEPPAPSEPEPEMPLVAAPAEPIVDEPVMPEESVEQVVEEDTPPPPPPMPAVPEPIEEEKDDSVMVQEQPLIVIDPSAPPEVPPPLLPQAGGAPQFFDADGKNANPFLNPS